jgi:hypothetical protein
MRKLQDNRTVFQKGPEGSELVVCAEVPGVVVLI